MPTRLAEVFPDELIGKPLLDIDEYYHDTTVSIPTKKGLPE